MYLKFPCDFEKVISGRISLHLIIFEAKNAFFPIVNSMLFSNLQTCYCDSTLKIPFQLHTANQSYSKLEMKPRKPFVMANSKQKPEFGWVNCSKTLLH